MYVNLKKLIYTINYILYLYSNPFLKMSYDKLSMELCMMIFAQLHNIYEKKCQSYSKVLV